MLALVLFAVAMIFLTKVVHNNNNSTRSEFLAGQIVEQINPFLHDLNEAPNRLQSRFMLAVIKKSFDIFDESYDAKMGLYDLDGHLLVQTEGSDLPKQLPPPRSWFAQTFPTLAGVPPTASARVLSPAGYTVFFEPRQSPKHNVITAMFNVFTGTLLLLVIMGVAIWWIAHSMTKRLNQMSKQMQRLGEGDFSVRVPVKGKDEIATLAIGFNQSAEKIEKLINANNLLLAHASHEFRTPITRMRLQVEMMDMIAEQLSDKGRAMFTKRANAITRDLTGLNDLIESILLVSRLDAGHALQQTEKLDIYHLVEKETRHYPEATLHGKYDDNLIIQGQPKLLTHLIRNLLNNAVIHGIAPIDVYLYAIENEEQASDIPSHLLAHHSSTDQPKEEESDKLAGLEKQDESSLDDDHQEETQDLLEEQSQEQLKDSSQEQSKKFKYFTPKMPAISNVKMPTMTMPSMPSMPHIPNIPNIHRKAHRNRQLEKVTPNFVALSVIDHGTGIAEEKREDIFSPFVRLKQEKKGSGLGLSLVAQIVEAHNGSIVTDTWQGRTRFLVVLPIRAKG